MSIDLTKTHYPSLRPFYDALLPSFPFFVFQTELDGEEANLKAEAMMPNKVLAGETDIDALVAECFTEQVSFGLSKLVFDGDRSLDDSTRVSRMLRLLDGLNKRARRQYAPKEPMEPAKSSAVMCLVGKRDGYVGDPWIKEGEALTYTINTIKVGINHMRLDFAPAAKDGWTTLVLRVTVSLYVANNANLTRHVPFDWTKRTLSNTQQAYVDSRRASGLTPEEELPDFSFAKENAYAAWRSLHQGKIDDFALCTSLGSADLWSVNTQRQRLDLDEVDDAGNFITGGTLTLHDNPKCMEPKWAAPVDVVLSNPMALSGLKGTAIKVRFCSCTRDGFCQHSELHYEAGESVRDVLNRGWHIMELSSRSQLPWRSSDHLETRIDDVKQWLKIVSTYRVPDVRGA